MEERKPWRVTISPGCILYILVVVCIFWFCIRTINKCTEPERQNTPTKITTQSDTVFIHDTIWVEKQK